MASTAPAAVRTCSRVAGGGFTGAGGANSSNGNPVGGGGAGNPTTATLGSTGGRIGVAYNQPLAASGANTGPITFAVTAGTLPAGLTLSAAGALSGTPTAFGRFPFTVTATAAGAAPGSRVYTLVVVPTHLVVTPVSPDGHLNVTVPDGTKDGKLVYQLEAFGGTFHGLLNLAVGDLTGDGTDEIVVGAGPTGASRVTVFDGATGLAIEDFFAYSPDFRGGVNVAVVAGELVTGAGPGGGPHVKLYRAGTQVASFFAFASDFLGGVTVAAGVVNERPVLVAVPMSGGGPVAVVFDVTTGSFLTSYYIGQPDDRGGVKRVVLNEFVDPTTTLLVTEREVLDQTGTVVSRRYDAYRPLTGENATVRVGLPGITQETLKLAFPPV